MKILFNSHTPFMLAHGGAQIQIEQTKAALEKIGVEVDFLRWWDGSQKADIIHFFGRPTATEIHFAHQKGIKYVMLHLLTGLGSRGPLVRKFQKMVTRTGMKFLPPLSAAYRWDTYAAVDACIANTAWEKYLTEDVFGAAPEKIHIVGNGVENVFLSSEQVPRGKWLVCSGTITERKKILELAEAAVKAGTPVWIIGKGYSDSDPYTQRFLTFARQHPEIVRYEGPVNDRKKLSGIYREARGFVLLSTMETRSLSSEEAAACECPLLLSDLPWARDVFGEGAAYCPPNGSLDEIAQKLRGFYDAAPNRPIPAKPKSWIEVAHQFRAVYEQVMKTPIASAAK
jgi:glycosyltransferase involved in cell wall biosynthesis